METAYGILENFAEIINFRGYIPNSGNIQYDKKKLFSFTNKPNLIIFILFSFNFKYNLNWQRYFFQIFKSSSYLNYFSNT